MPQYFAPQNKFTKLFLLYIRTSVTSRFTVASLIERARTDAGVLA